MKEGKDERRKERRQAEREGKTLSTYCTSAQFWLEKFIPINPDRNAFTFAHILDGDVTVKCR